MNKFDFRLHINGTPTKWRPAECHVVTEIHVFDRISMFSPTVLASVQTLCAPCTSQLHSLEHDTVILPVILRISYVSMQSESQLVTYCKYFTVYHRAVE